MVVVLIDLQVMFPDVERAEWLNQVILLSFSCWLINNY